MKDEFKRIQHKSRHLGPGGYKCHCCGPHPKDRKAHRRATRSRLKRETVQEVSEATD
jgi:hypothetical protein